MELFYSRKKNKSRPTSQLFSNLSYNLRHKQNLKVQNGEMDQVQDTTAFDFVNSGFLQGKTSS